jgi:transposase
VRRLLVVGVTAVIWASRKRGGGFGWLVRLLERKRPKVAAVALANKMARIVWAVLVRTRHIGQRRIE